MAEPSGDPRFPIGPFAPPTKVTERDRARWVDDLARAPQALREALQGLDDAQLATPYRAGGWTVRQVAHHLADSHVNGFIRFKVALTEDHPTIKPYREAAWAELVDSKTVPVSVSVQLLAALHERWNAVLVAMSPGDWQRTYFHPEKNAAVTLESALALYSWHSRHHVAHITTLRDKKRW